MRERDPSIDARFLKLAYQLAGQYSPDPSTQNAALLVDFSKDECGRTLCMGVNQFPRDVLSSPERWQRPAKYQFVEHAERNVIYEAARRGTPTSGLTMYCPWAACTDCARAIIQAGITELVTHRFEGDESDRWDESIAVAMQMLSEARVIVRTVREKLATDDSISLRRNGVLIHP